jgi:DNA-binding transcriptional ArsR family regulator
MGRSERRELQSFKAEFFRALSHPLAVLRTKNVVSTRKEGTTVRYSLRDPLLGDLLDVARRIFSHHLIGTQTLLRELRAERTHRR